MVKQSQELQELEEELYKPKLLLRVDVKKEHVIRSDGLLIVFDNLVVDALGRFLTKGKKHVLAKQFEWKVPVLMMRLLNPLEGSLFSYLYYVWKVPSVDELLLEEGSYFGYAAQEVEVKNVSQTLKVPTYLEQEKAETFTLPGVYENPLEQEPYSGTFQDAGLELEYLAEVSLLEESLAEVRVLPLYLQEPVEAPSFSNSSENRQSYAMLRLAYVRRFLNEVYDEEIPEELERVLESWDPTKEVLYVVHGSDGTSSVSRAETGDYSGMSILQALGLVSGYSQRSGYVYSIGGITARENSGWVFYVNGVMPNVSADSYVLKPGDVVVWNYVSEVNGS